ncbi:hypothetical protein MNBD_BACTEROID01-73 [hydrothermal vent metagenome]|uniref:Uncharacterized protein n=1 Tax=hydrothermal vent metagenome TaxID=652676 RepID=A0A3B0UW14_9ZZZZ
MEKTAIDVDVGENHTGTTAPGLAAKNILLTKLTLEL